MRRSNAKTSAARGMVRVHLPAGLLHELERITPPVLREADGKKRRMTGPTRHSNRVDWAMREFFKLYHKSKPIAQSM